MLIANLIMNSYMDSLTRAMDVVANNVANASTTGFKRQEVQFDTLITHPSVGEQTDFASERGTFRDVTQGPMLTTGNPLDVAIQGAGYFMVQTKDGTRYSRGGSFQVDSSGVMVTASGDKVLGDGDQPITVPSDAQDLHVSADGVITARTGGSATTTQIGKLKVVKFKDEQSLQALGGGLYSTGAAPDPDPDSRLVQGMVEQSNVQSVGEMTKMIDILRNYQMAAHMLDLDNQRQTDAINRLGKVAA